MNARRIGAASVLAVALYFALSVTLRDPGPRTLEDVIPLAEHLGLYWRHDSWHGTPGTRLIVSTRPVRWEEAHRLLSGRPERPEWVGVVSVYTVWRGMTGNFVPGRTVIWGELFVCGDPELIRRLTGLDPGTTQPLSGLY
jgi:hypothetical protein